MTIALREIEYFLEIHKRGSITAAARALGVTQPSLTVAVQRLEKHFGTTLFLRSRRGVALTVTGRALAADAEEIVATLARTVKRIAGLEGDEVGRFSIGCHESLGAYFLPGFLSGFLDAHRGITITLRNESSAAVRDDVVLRELDFGIVVNPVTHPDLVLVPLFGDAMDFFAARKPARDLASAHERIRKGPLVHAGRVTESRSLIDGLERDGVVAQNLISCGDFELVKALVLADVGVGILPRRVAAYGQEGKLVRLHPRLPFFEDRIFLVYRGDLHKTRAAMTLKDALVSFGKKLR